MRSLNTLALLVGFAAMGCSDSGSVSGVYPSSGYLGRTVRVEVSGDNVEWKEGATLDFGPGVTVSNVTVASRTSLFADVVIGDTATPGLRDVVVRQGDNMKTLSGAFELESPLKMTYMGKLAQGSVVAFTARNLDFLSPFDTTCGASFFGMCLEYTNMSVVTPAGVNAFVNSVDAYEVSGTMYIDIDAESGPISLVSGPPEVEAEQVTSPVGLPTEIAARTATALGSSPTTATVEDTFDSQLYEYTSSGMSLARFKVSASEQDAAPTVFILPASGHFMEMITASDYPKVVSTGSEKFYAVYVDGSGLSGYTYNIRVNPLPVTAMQEAAANDTSAQAQQAAQQNLYVGPMTLSSATDQDWIKFAPTSGDSTKSVHVFTTGTDSMTDTVIEVHKMVGGNLVSLGESDDSDYHDTLDSDVIGTDATMLYVKIKASDYFQPSHSGYFTVIWVE